MPISGTCDKYPTTKYYPCWNQNEISHFSRRFIFRIFPPSHMCLKCNGWNVTYIKCQLFSVVDFYRPFSFKWPHASYFTSSEHVWLYSMWGGAMAAMATSAAPASCAALGSHPLLRKKHDHTPSMARAFKHVLFSKPDTHLTSCMHFLLTKHGLQEHLPCTTEFPIENIYRIGFWHVRWPENTYFILEPCGAALRPGGHGWHEARIGSSARNWPATGRVTWDKRISTGHMHRYAVWSPHHHSLPSSSQPVFGFHSTNLPPPISEYTCVYRVPSIHPHESYHASYVASHPPQKRTDTWSRPSLLARSLFAAESSSTCKITAWLCHRPIWNRNHKSSSSWLLPKSEAHQKRHVWFPLQFLEDFLLAELSCLRGPTDSRIFRRMVRHVCTT